MDKAKKLFGGDKTEPDGRFDEARNLLNPLRKNVAKVQDELKKNQKYLRDFVKPFEHLFANFSLFYQGPYASTHANARRHQIDQLAVQIPPLFKEFDDECSRILDLVQEYENSLHQFKKRVEERDQKLVEYNKRKQALNGKFKDASKQEDAQQKFETAKDAFFSLNDKLIEDIKEETKRSCEELDQIYFSVVRSFSSFFTSLSSLLNPSTEDSVSTPTISKKKSMRGSKNGDSKKKKKSKNQVEEGAPPKLKLPEDYVRDESSVNSPTGSCTTFDNENGHRGSTSLPPLPKKESTLPPLPKKQPSSSSLHKEETLPLQPVRESTLPPVPKKVSTLPPLPKKQPSSSSLHKDETLPPQPVRESTLPPLPKKEPTLPSVPKKGPLSSPQSPQQVRDNDAVITLKSFIPEEEQKKYLLIFKREDPNGSGYIDGPKSLEFFTRSGLNTATLSDIWELSDQDIDGKLDKSEFVIAMWLINSKLKGEIKEIPQELHPALIICNYPDKKLPFAYKI